MERGLEIGDKLYYISPGKYEIKVATITDIIKQDNKIIFVKASTTGSKKLLLLPYYKDNSLKNFFKINSKTKKHIVFFFMLEFALMELYSKIVEENEK